jgi:putative sterol carrier protein
MAQVTDALFEDLRRRGHEPLLGQAQGTIRFELENARSRRWFVEVDKGDVVVSHANRRADCTIRADEGLFDRIARGEINAMAAVLRGAVTIEGDPELIMLFQRLFPGPPQDTPRPSGGRR